tara:strand:+ start:16842 stop:16946 length:105 start_codon:yes stop_codon:yes gene_type:complete
MACQSCQKRREALKRLAKKLLPEKRVATPPVERG